MTTLNFMSGLETEKVLTHPMGLKFKDGQKLPIYDWVSTGTPIEMTH
jgi:hypothetical protein